jgi:alkylated DNA repair protein alkB family protein 6
MSAASTLDAAVVESLPKTVYYIPDFITADEETQLLRNIASQPKPKWTVLSHRRLQTHPSALTASNVLLAAPLPDWLSSLVPRMQALGIWDSAPHHGPNHVLINEYNPSEGIMAHEDGAAYYPMVATVSLGAPIVLDIYEKGEGGRRAPKWRILQEPRRLVTTPCDGPILSISLSLLSRAL